MPGILHFFLCENIAERSIGVAFIICKPGTHHAYLVEQFIAGAIGIRLSLDVKTKDRINSAIVVKVFIIQFSGLLITGAALGVQTDVADNEVGTPVLIKITGGYFVPPTAIGCLEIR